MESFTAGQLAHINWAKRYLPLAPEGATGGEALELDADDLAILRGLLERKLPGSPCAAIDASPALRKLHAVLWSMESWRGR